MSAFAQHCLLRHTVAVDMAYAVVVVKARLHETAAMNRCGGTGKSTVVDSHQGLLVLGWHLEALCGHPLRRHVLSPSHRLCIRLAHHILLLPAGNGRNYCRCTALVLDAQDSLMVLSVKHRTHAPARRHTDPDLQVLLSELGVAASCRATSYKATCRLACSRVALELQAKCAIHRFVLSQTRASPA